MELSQGEFENIENLIDDSLGQTNPEIPAIKLTSDEIDNIRITFTSLVTKWKSLNSKDSLLLKF
jgi:hypothetical protein